MRRRGYAGYGRAFLLPIAGAFLVMMSVHTEGGAVLAGLGLVYLLLRLGSRLLSDPGVDGYS